MGRVDAPLAVVRPSQNPDLRLSRIRLFAKRIVHIYQLYTLTYIRGLTNTGMINSVDLERKADELILDLNAVVQMAKMESDGKFRIFLMIFDKIKPINNPIDREINKKLVHELFASNAVAPDSFWTLLKKPEDYKDELAFYKKEDELQEGYADLPTT